MRLLLTLVVVLSVVLAGCFGGGKDDEPVPTSEFCAEQGLELREENGTLACLEPLPPAVVALRGVPESSMAHYPVAFEWVLTTHKGEAHAMLTSVRVATDSVPDAALDGPSSFGQELDKREHQDFTSGASYGVEHRFREPGSYFLRGYAEVEGKHLWSPEVVLRVDPVVPTGEQHTVTVPPGAFLQGPSPSEIRIGLGDEVRFVNEDIMERTLLFTGPAEVEAVALAIGGTSEARAFLVPGEYRYQSDDAVDQLKISGTIVVESP